MEAELRREKNREAGGVWMGGCRVRSGRRLGKSGLGRRVFASEMDVQKKEGRTHRTRDRN